MKLSTTPTDSNSARRNSSKVKNATANRRSKKGTVNATSKTLRFGPYSMPHGFGVGDMIHCTYRGRDVVIGGITDAPVQWFKIHNFGKPFVILCEDLIRAVQSESGAAIAHNWGVNDETVRNWRRALGVGRMTPGTTQVFRTIFEARISPEVAEKGRIKSRSKASNQKRIASLTGRKMHPITRKALLKAVKRPKSQAHREAISLAHKKRGTPSPNGRQWTEAEDAVLGTAPDKVLSKKLNRSAASVRMRRTRLQIPKYQGTRAHNS